MMRSAARALLVPLQVVGVSGEASFEQGVKKLPSQANVLQTEHSVPFMVAVRSKGIMPRNLSLLIKLLF